MNTGSNSGDSWREFAAHPPEPVAWSGNTAAAPEPPPGPDADDHQRTGADDADPPAVTRPTDEAVAAEVEPCGPATGSTSELAGAVEALRDDVRLGAEVCGRQRELVDKLHEENQRLRRAELERMRDPLVRDLISLADTCLRNGRAWLQRASADPADVAQVLHGVSDDVGLILERHGIDVFQPQAGAPFDRAEARAVRVVETPDATLRDLVAEVLKPGYRMGDRIIRYGEVAVWTTASPPNEDPPIP